MRNKKIIVIGAGIGGLISAIKLRVPTKDVKIFVSNNHQFTFVPYLSFYDRQDIPRNPANIDPWKIQPLPRGSDNKLYVNATST